MLDKLKGLYAYYRKGGAYEALCRLSGYGYLPKPVFGLSAKYILKLDKAQAPSLRYRLTGYEFERVDASAIDGLLACQGADIDTPAMVFERFFAQGHSCYVARKAGRIVAYFWTFNGQYRLAFDAEEKLTITLALPDNEIFFGNGYIHRDYRLKGLFPALMKFITTQYPEGTGFFSSVDLINEVSIRAHRRYGFVVVSEVTCLRLLTRTFFYQRPNASRRMRFLGAKALALPLSVLYAPASRAPLLSLANLRKSMQWRSFIPKEGAPGSD